MAGTLYQKVLTIYLKVHPKYQLCYEKVRDIAVIYSLHSIKNTRIISAINPITKSYITLITTSGPHI